MTANGVARQCAAGELCNEWDRRAAIAGQCDRGDTRLCPSCLHRASADIAALILDYVDLEQQIPVRGPAGEPISGTREPPSLINLSAEAHQRSIWLLTTTWENELHTHLGSSVSATLVRDGWAVQRAVQMICRHLRLLSILPAVVVMPEGPDGSPEYHDGTEAILAMSALHRRLRRALGLTKLVYQLPGECQRCRWTTLRRESGSETVYCEGCQARQSWDDYQQYATKTAQQWWDIPRIAYFELDDYLPATQAADLAQVNLATLRVWRARGRLKGRRDGRVWTYRARDVLILGARRRK